MANKRRTNNDSENGGGVATAEAPPQSRQSQDGEVFNLVSNFLAPEEQAARANVVQSFTASNEYRDHLVALAFVNYLGRVPSVAIAFSSRSPSPVTALT